MSGDSDLQAARELELYADNDGALYKQREPYLANMRRRMAKGTYKVNLGVKLWEYFAERAARKYAKEFASEREWSKIFSKTARHVAAGHFERVARAELKGG